MNVELDEIRFFTVLATTLHFGKASEQLHISQPALSKKIQRLEEKLGGQLLRRTRRRVSLTEPGRVFLLKSKKLLDETDSAVSATQAAVEGKAGRLRIGFGIASVSGILPRTILQFRKSYPGVELQMRDMSPQRKSQRFWKEPSTLAFFAFRSLIRNWSAVRFSKKSWFWLRRGRFIFIARTGLEVFGGIPLFFFHVLRLRPFTITP